MVLSLIFSQASKMADFRSAIELYCFPSLYTSLHNLAHMFSIGFKSGDKDGHAKVLILLSENHFCVCLA